nr:unnamed protein product [Callosobruchus chinensis]
MTALGLLCPIGHCFLTPWTTPRHNSALWAANVQTKPFQASGFYPSTTYRARIRRNAMCCTTAMSLALRRKLANGSSQKWTESELPQRHL